MNARIPNFVIKALVAGVCIGLMAGCATTKQLEEVRAEAAAAQRAAEEAQNMVTSARSMMQEALETARAAQSAANASQQCCTDLERKLDRALQDLQRK